MYEIPFDIQATSREGVQATSGGKGSFDYVNTHVYGPAQNSRFFMPVNEAEAWADVFPGGGGGARLPGRRYFGSRVGAIRAESGQPEYFGPGFSPHGAILIRLIKIV